MRRLSEGSDASLKSIYHLGKRRKLVHVLFVIDTTRTPDLDLYQQSENRGDQMATYHTEYKSDDDNHKCQSETLLYVTVIPLLTFAILSHYDKQEII